jgi:hypothetical protein
VTYRYPVSFTCHQDNEDDFNCPRRELVHYVAHSQISEEPNLLREIKRKLDRKNLYRERVLGVRAALTSRDVQVRTSIVISFQIVFWYLH